MRADNTHVRRSNHKRVHNNNIMLMFGIILILTFTFIGGRQFVHANESVEYEKSFQAIEIQPGDTLTSIAEEYATSEAVYQDYMDEVIEINQLKDDQIHAGCYLMVPVYSAVSSK